MQHRGNSVHQTTNPREAASYAASAEIDRATKFGIGEEGFEMNSLPGDKPTMDSGIKKTTRIDVESSSQRGLGWGGGERGDNGIHFV